MRIKTLMLVALLAVPVAAADIVQWAEPDGTIKLAQIENVRKDTETEFSARIRVQGRVRSLKIPSRLVVQCRRGNSDDINQWSKRLATGKRLMAAGQIATVGTVPGAEEIFIKATYTTEQGTKGQEKSERVAPWHNMYALFYLIEAQYALGLEGNAPKLQEALDNIGQFQKRSASKSGKKIDWEVPAQKGTTRTAKIYCWGETRLWTSLLLYKARILAAQKKPAEALAAFDEVITHIKKRGLSPVLLVESIEEKAALDAEGKSSEQQEALFHAAGNALAAQGRTQADDYGKQLLALAANRALLRGADLLLESAKAGSLSYDMALKRYRTLQSGKGSKDRALYFGALAGAAVCLTEKGEGKAAYEALLEVVTEGYEYPDQMARALFYLSKAAPKYADEIDAAGGKGDFLRLEAPRWLNDLKDRYPGSNWAKQAQSK